MEGRRPRNRNPSHSSASFSQSPRPRGQKLPSNATHRSKVSTFAQRGTPSAPDSSNRQEDADAQGSSDFGPLVGTCPYMCPERERNQREKLRDLAVFERQNGNPEKSSPALVVKKERCRLSGHTNTERSF